VKYYIHNTKQFLDIGVAHISSSSMNKDKDEKEGKNIITPKSH